MHDDVMMRVRTKRMSAYCCGVCLLLNYNYKAAPAFFKHTTYDDNQYIAGIVCVCVCVCWQLVTADKFPSHDPECASR